MLKVKNLNLHYGAIHALHNIDFEVKKGTIVTLIGSNGAGKTSILHSISNIVNNKSGEIYFEGNNISKLKAHKIVEQRLCHVPEGRHVFASMTVKENLKMGAYIRNDIAEIKHDYEKVLERFPRLRERRNQLAGTLSGGEQQMLAMGRALMSRPKLLMMDEPSMGLAPILVNEIFDIIQSINKDGTTILLVEQNAHMALSIADYAYVLETGHILFHGSAKEMLNNDNVKKAYLGN